MRPTGATRRRVNLDLGHGSSTNDLWRRALAVLGLYKDAPPEHGALLLAM